MDIPHSTDIWQQDYVQPLFKKYAGVYLESNVLANQSYYNDGTSTKAILI